MRAPLFLRGIPCMLLWLCACTVERDGDAALSDSVPAQTPATGEESPLAAARRHFEAVPDSVLIRRGACPFECCVYGEWRAVDSIPVLSEADGSAALAWTLQPGAAFTASNGEVRILGPAIIAVTDTVRHGSADEVVFVPGDTLVVLDYVGEGFFNLWHRGRVVREVGGFWGAEADSPKGAYYGDYRKEWWVHIVAPGEGWFRADSTFRHSGADACG